MYLSKLQIKGFKSFARKTELVFNDGITAIVGPNGCGKTNIIDAIRWVLGEQKPGVLRGEKMDNVIFSGTQRVKPQAMAEVSLTIQNTRGILPVDYSEVVVTRRLYRSGESEYLLNKTPCRLKDIQNLFVDTGMGPDSYSVIELKMIESILSNKAEERSRLFEEAAGINKYKQHRYASLRKLEATEVDLNRVNDIIAEVEHNVNSLKRQVSKTERYKKLTNEIEALDIRIASLEYANILKELQPLRKQLDQKEKVWQASRTELSREEAIVEKLRAEILTVEEQLTNLRQEVEQVMKLIHKRENDLAVNQERQRSFKEKIERYQKEMAQAKKRKEILLTHLQQSRPKLVSLQEKVDSLKMKFRLKSQELDESDKILVRRRLEVNNSRLQLIELLKEIGEREKKRNHLESQIVHLKGRKRQLADESARLATEIQVLEQELQNQHKKEIELNREVEALRQMCEQKQQELEEGHQTAEALREQILNVRNALDTLERQQAFVQNLIELKGGYAESARLLAQHQSEFEGLLGLFSDLISAPKAYRPAIEAIVGDTAHYFVVEKMEQMPPILDFLQQHHSGQVTFLILERIPASNTNTDETSLIEEPGVIGPASAFVKADQRLQQLITFVLGDYLIVKNREVLKNLAEKTSWNLVTLEGEVATQTGILRSGWYDAGKRLSQIGKNDQLKELEVEKETLNQKLKDLEKQQKTHQQKLSRITAELEKSQQQLKEKEAVHLQQRLQTVQKQTALDKSRERLDSNQKEVLEIENRIADSERTLAQLKPQLDELVQKRRRHEDQMQPLQDKLEELENQRNRLADDVHQLNLNVVRTTAEYHNLEQEIQRLERTVSDLEQTIIRQEREIEDTKQEIQRLVEVLATDGKTLTELRERLQLLQTRQQEKQRNHDALRERLQKREAMLKETRQAGDSSADSLRTFKVRITELEAQATYLQEKIKEKYGVEITPVEPKESENLSELRQELEKLQHRLRTFGPVNLLALEDYQKESERLSFLQKQREDLVEAKNTLVETISIINKTAREKLENVFEQIRSNFRNNFQVFFEGGEGDLQIRFNPEDPLDAEILILVRPKGKELGSLALLSGGEKALTAIALLFSIYQVKPSPFCVLDEVDAPLDDANLQRFLKVIRNFVGNVQFIIVTHNKVTMGAADYLYGVTMEEEGISKLVSVKLESNEIDKYVE